jgi:hypothetical protein
VGSVIFSPWKVKLTGEMGKTGNNRRLRVHNWLIAVSQPIGLWMPEEMEERPADQR